MDWADIPRADLLEKLDGLLQTPVDKLHGDFGRLQRSLLKHRDNIFRFLSDSRVPYDNNASERAIRIVKVKQKISGGFRNDIGADRFTQLLSVADTSKKNGMSRFKALGLIAKRERRCRAACALRTYEEHNPEIGIHIISFNQG